MSVTAVNFPLGPSERYLGRAEVIGPGGEGGRLWVRLPSDHRPREAWAVAGRELAAGAAVLVAEGEDAELFVVGVLGAAPRAGAQLTTRAGAVAEMDADEETLRVRSPAGELIFEYQPAQRRTVVRVPEGDLEIAAPEGCIELRSGQDIRVRGERSVSVSGGERVGVTAGSSVGGGCSGVELGQSLMRLSSPVLRVHAERGEATVGEVSVQGETLSTRWNTAKVIANRLETWSGEVVTRAREVHQRVEQLWQVKAGRLRAVAVAACQLQGRKVLLRAEEDVKVRGDRIELG